MLKVFVGIGSNVERDKNLRSGVQALQAAFAPVQLSTVYSSAAVGFEGDDFFNMIAAFDTELSAAKVAAALREIEENHARGRGHSRFAPRSLDLDLLMYGDMVSDLPGLVLPRQDIIRYAFVLLPMMEIAPETRHPVSGKTMAELWVEFDASKQALVAVEFDFGDDG